MHNKLVKNLIIFMTMTAALTAGVLYNSDPYWFILKAAEKESYAPVVTLNGPESIALNSLDNYSEQGATAVDDQGTELEVSTSDFEQINDYTYRVVYTATDMTGHDGTAERTIVLKDLTPPEITMFGHDVVIPEREHYLEPGATATDDRDGDVSESITTTGYVDIYRPGEYTVTYTAKDSAGNISKAERKVTIERVHYNPENAIYLTFDDGPSPGVTDEILDVLAEYNIKATFFICNYSEEGKALIQRMINEGHTVGIHGYSHVYSDIYASTDAFINNVYSLKDKLKNDTGYDAFAIRFPGGSGNLISASYSEGIMTELVNRFTEDDMMYVDWNVSGADAEDGGDHTAEEIYNAVTAELKLDRSNVVLLHDISSKQSTADTVKKIIEYGIENGFSFYPIEQETVPIHQSVLN